MVCFRYIIVNTLHKGDNDNNNNNNNNNATIAIITIIIIISWLSQQQSTALAGWMSVVAWKWRQLLRIRGIVVVNLLFSWCWWTPQPASRGSLTVSAQPIADYGAYLTFILLPASVTTKRTKSFLILCEGTRRTCLPEDNIRRVK